MRNFVIALFMPREAEELRSAFEEQAESADGSRELCDLFGLEERRKQDQGFVYFPSLLYNIQCPVTGTQPLTALV